MTTKLKPITVYFSADELARLASEAAPHGYSVAQYIRRFLELPVLSRGAPNGNQNARKTPVGRNVKNRKISVEKPPLISEKRVPRQSKKSGSKSQEKLFE
jgi:hypothetical protein